MNILTILAWLRSHGKIAANAVLSVAVALLLSFSINTYTNNKKLSAALEIAQNNIEAYLGSINGSLLAYNVLKLDMQKLSEQNDRLIQKIDSVRKEQHIKAKDLSTAATQTQILYVNKSKGVEGDIIQILKDTVYTDSMLYNDLTKVHYSIGTDSVSISIDLKNTLYLYVYKQKEYKNKKNFLKRLFTLDFKKVTKYKYNIVNTNDLLKEEDVRIIEKQ